MRMMDMKQTRITSFKSERKEKQDKRRYGVNFNSKETSKKHVIELEGKRPVRALTRFQKKDKARIYLRFSGFPFEEDLL
jgi:hypothetical protein